MRDAFHQAAVAHEHVGEVIDDVEAVAVEARREHLFGERHADRIGETLAERTGRRLDAGRFARFGMSRGLRMQLAEMLDLVDRQVVAGQMQQRVLQHRAVAVRQHEAIAVGPLRILRVVAEEIVPEHFGDVGHAHRHARDDRISRLRPRPWPARGSRWRVLYGSASAARSEKAEERDRAGARVARGAIVADDGAALSSAAGRPERFLNLPVLNSAD